MGEKFEPTDCGLLLKVKAFLKPHKCMEDKHSGYWANIWILQKNWFELEASKEHCISQSLPSLWLAPCVCAYPNIHFRICINHKWYNNSRGYICIQCRISQCWKVQIVMFTTQSSFWYAWQCNTRKLSIQFRHWVERTNERDFMLYRTRNGISVE